MADYDLFMYFVMDIYPVSVKFWEEYQVYVYVMRKSCNKTHFWMIYAVWQLFLRFLVVFYDERGSWERVGNARNAYNRLLHVGRLGSQQSFLVLCRDSGFYVVTGFGLSKVFLGHDCVFSLS